MFCYVKVYYNCSCLKGATSGSNITAATETTVKSGKCTEECHLIYVFLALLLLGIFSRFLLIPAAVSVTLRCIKEKQKTFGLGVQWFVVRLVGTIPGPVLFGAVIDGSCLVWQEKCGENSSCWIYNNGLLSQNFFVILVSVKICTSLFFIIAFKIYKKPVCKNPLNGSVMVNIGSEGTDNQTEVDILSGSVGNGNNVT